ncbi:DinB family protein [Candidatus Gracilibacteria bacterium]|nr:DinB family protein [Candidatus Gracilibacteria bacterium]
MARVRTLLDEQPDAVLAGIDIHALAQQNDYAAADLRAALATFIARRQQFIAVLEALSDEQWLLAGVHPEQGPATVLDVAVNSGLHDIDHIEQIIRCA